MVDTFVRAPELIGRGGWINTGGRTLTLSDFRGRFLLIDHWTLCCANCLHVLDELRPIERKYRELLTVIGAHAPKFKHEQDHQALIDACERYGVEHPVLDDPELITWKNYAVKAWPTLSLIDPKGYLIAQFSGEGHAHAIDRMINELLPQYRDVLTPGPSLYVAPEKSDTQLRFPAKAIVLDDQRLMVANPGHHDIAITDYSGNVIERIGKGTRGSNDGDFHGAEFQEPNGLLLLPPDVASRVGYEVLVADTANHLLRAINLKTKQVITVAGNGQQWMQGQGTESLSTPWDLAWFSNLVIIAMAGIHQLWSFDPTTGDVAIYAGTTNEGMVDGNRLDAWFAQTSGLAVTGNQLWIADSETSSLRFIENDVVKTVIGASLLDFGFIDGDKSSARMQHPLGVDVLPDQTLIISDTYNGALRRFNPQTGLLSTVAKNLREPSGIIAISNEEVLVVESSRHQLTRVTLQEEVVQGEALRTERPPLEISGGTFTLDVVFLPPPGEKLDERYGPSTRLILSSTPTNLIREGAGKSQELIRTLEIDPAVGSGILHIAASAASCDNDGGTCHIHQQDWGIPVLITEQGATQLRLPLSG